MPRQGQRRQTTRKGRPMVDPEFGLLIGAVIGGIAKVTVRPVKRRIARVGGWRVAIEAFAVLAAVSALLDL